MAYQWALVIAGSILLLTLIVVLAWTHERARGPAAGVVVGAVCGLVGAFLIVQPRLDMVPDAFEPLGVALIIVIVSLGLILLTLRGLRRN